MAIKGNGKNNYKCNYTERKQYSINGWKEKTLGQVVVVVGCFFAMHIFTKMAKAC